MKKNDLLILASLALYSYLFYEQSAGINFLIFSPVLVLLLFIKDKTLIINKTWLFASFTSIATAIAVFIYGNDLSVIANIISISLMGSVSINKDSSLILALLYSLYSYVSSMAFIVINVVSKKINEKKQKNPITTKILLIIIPVIITLIFFFLYREANPIFKNFTKNINLDFITWSWIRFTLFGFVLLYGFFNHRKIQYLFNKDLQTSDALSKESGLEENSSISKNLSKENENLSGIILFALLNILLLAVNVLDINFLFSSAIPEGTTFSDFVHQGIGALIVSIIIAISIILFYFRGELNFYKKNTAIKILAYLWIIQNAVLILTTASKNQLYISEYSLTYKRIGVYIYLLLSLIGLTTTFIKILKIKSNWFLFRKNSWAFYCVLIISCFFNWGLLVTNYNIQQKENLDKSYLLYLSQSSLPDLLNLENKNSDDIDNFYKHQLHEKTYQFLQFYKSAGWQSCNIENNRIYDEINKLHQEGKIKEMYLNGSSIESLAPINHFSAITSLNIGNTKFKNIEEIAPFKDLEYLNIESSLVDSLHKFPIMEKLKELQVSSNAIDNYYYLNNAKGLEKLIITNNKKQIYGYPALPDLQYLDLSGSPVENYSFQNFSNLKFLKLNNIYKDKLSTISYLKELKSLELSENYINQNDSLIFEIIFSHKKLENLNLSSNEIKSISSLTVPENNIKELNLSGNELLDLNGIEKFKNAESINLNNCKISSLLPLMALPNLVSLEISNNPTINLSSVQGLTNLKKLDISSDNISDISPITASLINLEDLDLSNNQLANLTSIANLLKLKKLNLKGCDIQNINIPFDKMAAIEWLQVKTLNTDQLNSIRELKNIKYLGCETLKEEQIAEIKKALPQLIIEVDYKEPNITAADAEVRPAEY